MQQHHAPANERNATRAAEICELALVALVTDLHIPSAEAAAILMAETSKHLSRTTSETWRVSLFPPPFAPPN